MAHILTVTAGLPSVLYPSIELARRLAAAGHRVTFAGVPEARGLAEHHGLTFLPLDRGHYSEFLEADARTGVLGRLLRLRSRRTRALDSMAIEGFSQALREAAPDLVLVNGEMHEHVIAAVAAGPPVALLNSFVSIWRQPGLPPPHTLVQPGVGCAGTRMGTSALWLALRARKRRRAWTQWCRRVGCDRLTMLRRLARRSGFDFRLETDDSQWLIPFTYRHLPVLTLHALEFEFPHRLPDGVHYVGPMVLESRVDREMPESSRAALAQVMERHGGSRGDRTLILAGFGSVFSTDLSFVRRLIEAVAARPDWELVISLGGRMSQNDLGPIPDRVHVFSWIPQVHVLRHADVAVIHGGINTVDECVLRGVPMLVYCGGETDMAGTTARVVYHGLGIAGDRRRDTAADIRAHIDRLLQDPRYGNRVRALQVQYESYAGRRVAERTVESLLERHSPRAPNDAGLRLGRSGEIS